MIIQLKRVYHPPHSDDGRRILVDRLWPRGLSKTTASIDYWAKDVAPSTELRHWYGHDQEKWMEFQQRYIAERSCKQSRNVSRSSCCLCKKVPSRLSMPHKKSAITMRGLSRSTLNPKCEMSNWRSKSERHSFFSNVL
ncbi:MAG: DUF488 family protein [Nitrospirales bacterium]|nr:DUF488 family protein [Nitrospirales bacterium]